MNRWKWPNRVLKVFLGLVAGLAAAELLFCWRDDGAFPHVNVYRPDAELGVRLEPGGTQKLAFGGNPVTRLRINREGYRGADLPAPGEGEILIVGDSQVFGLGVEEDQTFSARLAAQLGGKTVVVNGGVPTYGPGEYQAVVKEMLETRRPKTVVFTINMVNDLFEVARPNAGRHAVWDGWAVRKETSPGAVTGFPGRRWLFSRSHAFFAARRWWYERGPRIDEGGFASEGTWTDLVGAGTAARASHQEAEVEKGRRLQARHDALSQAERMLDETEDKLDDATAKSFPEQAAYDNEDGTKYRAARANPGDILEESDDFAESGRSVLVTTDLIRAGAAHRARLQAQLLAKARAQGKQEVVDAFAARTELGQRVVALDGQAIELPRVESPLLPTLREVKALCDAHGARLVVLVLPMDVQVSADEWKKYGVAARDMAPTRVLIDDVVADAAALGVSVLDATAVLAAAEPGAFLNRDIHMTPKGHQAVATALATTLAAPPPAPPPVASLLAPGRSHVPVPAVWSAAPEVRVTGSTRAGCETKRVREWLRVACRHVSFDAPTPVAIRVEQDARGEAMTLVADHHATTLVAPVLEGDELVVLFGWTAHTQKLRVSWPRGAAEPTMAFDAPVKVKTVANPPESSTPLEKELCKCWKKQYGGSRCNGAYGQADERCQATYANDCARLLECSRRDPASPPAPPAPAPPAPPANL